MSVIPAIDLLDGHAVFLTGGRRGTEDVVSERPTALAKGWQRRGAKRLHVLDLDAAMGSGDNRDLVHEILRAVAIPVQVGGGLRDEAALRDVLSSGAAMAVVGTRAVRDPAWLRAMAVRFPSRLILAVDRDERGVLVDGWQKVATADPAQLVDLANRIPLAGILFTNVSVEGRMRGVGEVSEDLVSRCKLETIAAGGATTVNDLRALRRAGYDHAIVGKALYVGVLDLAHAEEAMS